MKKYVFAIIDIDGRDWGAILKWELKPWHLRIFTRYKYFYKKFALSNNIEYMQEMYNEQYSHIKV